MLTTTTLKHDPALTVLTDWVTSYAYMQAEDKNKDAVIGWLIWKISPSI